LVFDADSRSPEPPFLEEGVGQGRRSGKPKSGFQTRRWKTTRPDQQGPTAEEGE
jgi:hypothetical protein